MSDPMIDLMDIITDQIVDLKQRIGDLESRALDAVEIKSTTGDPADPFEGRRVINTFDNEYRMYLDGAWRTIVAW